MNSLQQKSRRSGFVLSKQVQMLLGAIMMNAYLVKLRSLPPSPLIKGISPQKSTFADMSEKVHGTCQAGVTRNTRF